MLLTKQISIKLKTVSLIALFSFLLTNTFAVQIFANVKDTPTTNTSQYPTLTKYTTNLTQMAREGKLSSKANFEREVNQLIKSLSSNGSRQPVIVDEIGDNQELVVELLASRIASGDVPANLSGKSILKLEIESLFGKDKTAEEISQTVENAFAELAKTNGEIILFVNELTNFVGRSQLNDALANSLLEGKVKIIGGSSKAAYSEKIEMTAEVAALFQPILLEANNNQTAETETNLPVPQNRPFRGDNVSPDLREMLAQDETGGTRRIDVILQAKDANNPSLRAIMAQNKIRLTDQIGKTDTLVVNLPLSALNELSQSGLINYVSPNRQLKSLGHLETTSGTSVMRSQPAGYGRPAAYTLDGSGVGIAIVDSGIYAAQKSFNDGTSSSRVVYSQSFVEGVSSTEDDYGHGTHVASIAAGSATRNTNAYKGIAPKANLINLKVLNSEGVGTTSALLNALDWIYNNHTTYNIKVVNISLGTPAIDSYWNDPINQKVQYLNWAGILVVAAAGNNGKNILGQKVYGQVHSPGNDPSVLTVGASNSMGTDSRSDDVLASYSSHGPTRSYYVDYNGTKVFDNVIKPDIVAPGNKIVAAKARSTSLLIANNPTLTNSALNIAGDDNDMMYLSGTSMSAPAVSGAAALLFQLNPDLTPTMAKMILEYTAQPLNGYNMFEQGAGQLNVEGAVKLARLYKIGYDFNASASVGTALLQTGQAFPTASSAVGGTTFTWAQGILTNHAFLKGQAIADKYQNVYDRYWWFEDGVSYDANNNQSLDSYYYSAGITLNPNVMKSNGAAMGGGTIFCAAGVLISDGVLVADGVLFGDGVLISDGVLVADGVLVGDNTTASANQILITGDNTTAMY